MTVDIDLILENLVDSSNLTESEKIFVKKYRTIQDKYAQKAETESRKIIKKYAKREAREILRLYNKYFKTKKEPKENKTLLCPVCPELKDCPHAGNRTKCWEYDEAVKKDKI